MSSTNKAPIREHFPATSEQSRCCYRYADGERCDSTRDTHSFCNQHAVMIRAALASTKEPSC